MADRTSAAELLANPDALLTSTHLRELGLERRAIDAVFRGAPTVHLAGYSRPLVRVSDYLELVERSTHRGDRVRGGVQTSVHTSAAEVLDLQGRSRSARPRRLREAS